MIVKFFELAKKNLTKNKYYLFYGNNKGLIEETINKSLKPTIEANILRYDESDIIKDEDNLKETTSNKSFFDKKKLIIINRSSDKILKIIENIISKNHEDTYIVITSGILDKKSKLRNFFEKNKNTICVAFYEDNQNSLNTLALNFLRERKIVLSQQNLNLVIERSRGDRISLINELNKIENYAKGKKQIKANDIIKLTNLSENFDATELVNNTLAKNEKKTLYILNENNFSSEDTIIIIKIFINKLKRLSKLQSAVKINGNIETSISNFKPAIFWKEKDLLKRQLKILEQNEIKKLIIKINQIELMIKKYPSISTNIITDFILEQTNKINN